ncbi:hypothetical protein PF010_g21697 [Phytophthora fragariae]|uniref:Uncharacterized protein n=1 Tax=Phytophthora fragariae TaxID=53985 RepID=A0A6A3J9K2_9STRA|nr:hypothetical protein PF011_g17986 [Phytophthora fragariae]KAE9082170.1 hypothetical protein PF010_g21697 [Phytophthora fragariae]KAE9202788.1 hypothetical protein PF004_g18319 [Phytophthora fragariae]KAE9318042.1 hypothetical protein PF008_g18594 [Phytophthora fragariae]
MMLSLDLLWSKVENRVNVEALEGMALTARVLLLLLHVRVRAAMLSKADD